MTATHTTAGVEIPAPGIWKLDPGHAEVAFVGRHFGLTKIRGRFTDVDGTVAIADDITASRVEVTIQMASVASGAQTRDDHLRSGDFFDVAHYPTATFRSTELSVTATTAVMLGELTLRDVTRAVALDVDYLGQVADPWGNDRAAFSAHTRINREDWGLTWNMLLEAGGLLVSKEIDLEINVELIRQTS